MTLGAIQTACAEHLAALPYFTEPSVLRVLTEQLADYEGEIDRIVESLGLCLLILTVTARGARNNKAGLRYDEIEVRARALCDPALNRTGVSASDLAEAALKFLGDFEPISGCPMLRGSVLLVEDRQAPVAYDAILTLEAGSDAAPERPELP